MGMFHRRTSGYAVVRFFVVFECRYFYSTLPQLTIFQNSEGGIFIAQLDFPFDFPNSPPKMRFTSSIWHPNVYPDGRVCISILHPPGTDAFNAEETADERWRPILSVEAVLLSVMSMLADPNPNSPANIDAAVMFRKDPEAYKKRCKECVRRTLD